MDWSEKGMRMDKCFVKDGKVWFCYGVLDNLKKYKEQNDLAKLIIKGAPITCNHCGSDFSEKETEYKSPTGGTGEVDPEAMEIIRCLQCQCVWPAGHNYCPECGKALDGIDPEKSNYDEFFKKFIEYLYEDSDVPIEILKAKYSDSWIESHNKMMEMIRPSIDPMKEKAAKTVMDNLLFPDGYDFPNIKKTDCTECGNPNPEECRLCLDTFESSRTAGLNPGVDFEKLYCNQIKIAAKVFTDNIIMKTESESLKKLFVEEHREKIELKRQNKGFQDQYNDSGEIVDNLRNKLESMKNCNNCSVDDIFYMMDSDGETEDPCLHCTRCSHGQKPMTDLWKQKEIENAK